MELIDILNWRYAVKKYRNKEVEKSKVDQIVEAINLSASSAGMQPYRVIVVSNKEVQKRLREGSFNPQIEEASHLLVFTAVENVTKKHVEDYINLTASIRNMPSESLAEFKTRLEFVFLQKNTAQDNFTWAARQAYIGLGTGLVAAANLQVDSTPMEGFDPAKFDEVLGLQEKGLKSVVLLALGYRDEENDFLANLKKVRLPISEFAIEVR